MRQAGVHQLLGAARASDDALRAALGLQRLLQDSGVPSEIFTRADPGALNAIVRAYSDRAAWSRAGDVLLVRDDAGVGARGDAEVRGPGAPHDEWPGRVVAAPAHPPLLTPAELAQNRDAARAALRAAGVEVPERPRLRVALVSTSARSGLQTYSDAFATGLRAIGHTVDHIAVGWRDSGALLRRVRAIPRSTDLVIVEHEFGLFRDSALIAALGVLKLRRMRVLLSLHELEPDKFRDYVAVYIGAQYKQKGSLLFELARIPYSVLRTARFMLTYRLTLLALGWLPDLLVVHSDKAQESVGLITSDRSRVDIVPHFVEPLAGMPDVATIASDAGRRALRRELGLPEDRIVVVSPGFLFKRKRLREVAAATPKDMTLVIAGTGVAWEADHPAQIRAYIKEHGITNVVLDEDYDRMPKHLLAADAVVLYYKDIFQSGIASHAIWAEKPLVLSQIPSFRMYEGAALYAHDDAVLG
ncbi:MAG TPA: hypothetical protein VM052_02070 [Candidatus Limnocylindrales bacterium]|nr:hypothetical protein [Candidatus Limnocylindrales bacterium]